MEEVIKIQSSYRIIKKNSALLKEDASLINTTFEYNTQVYSNLTKEGQLIKKKDNKTNTDEEIKASLVLEIDEDRERIINEAIKEAEEIKLASKESGYKEGFDKGLEEGFNKGVDEGNKKGLEMGFLQGIENAKKEADEIKKDAINLLKDCQKEVSEYFDENRQRIIKLAAQMAESITHFTIDTSSEDIMQLIKPIMKQFKKVGNVIITCNPDNYEYVRRSIYEIEKNYENVNFIILEDETLEKNGCIVENDNQIFDLQIRKQLDNIVEKLENLEWLLDEHTIYRLWKINKRWESLY